MRTYLNLLSDILARGTVKENRTGVHTHALVGAMLRFDNIDQQFPLVTTKSVPFRMVFEEIMFFLRGESQTKILEEKGINIWKGNTSRTFLDQRGLGHLDEGDMGKGYGHQIRNFGSSGYDQLRALIAGLRVDPYGRRHVITHWCPFELKDAALPPCHLMHMYSVGDANVDGASVGDANVDGGAGGCLNSSFVMRSSDAFHGLPFNLAGYALLNILIANCCGLKPHTLVYFGHDVHIYKTHVNAVHMQMERDPKGFPKLVLKKNLYDDSIDETMKNLTSLTYDDVELIDYVAHPPIKVAMVV